MSLYTLLLKEKEAELLMEQFSVDGTVETSMALPLSILYFRLGKPEKAKEILLKPAKENRETKKLFRALINDDPDRHFEKLPDMGYRPNTMDEFLMLMQEEPVLLSQSAAYYLWADEVLKNESKSKQKIRKKIKRR